MAEKIKRRACRPQKEIDLKKVEKYASQLLTNDQIAINLGVCRKTFYVKKSEFPEIDEAIKRGREKGITKVINKLLESALAGNITAQIFILKTHGGPDWKEKQDVNLTGGLEVKQRTLKEMSDAELKAELAKYGDKNE